MPVRCPCHGTFYRLTKSATGCLGDYCGGSLRSVTIRSPPRWPPSLRNCPCRALSIEGMHRMNMHGLECTEKGQTMPWSPQHGLWLSWGRVPDTRSQVGLWLPGCDRRPAWLCRLAWTIVREWPSWWLLEMLRVRPPQMLPQSARRQTWARLSEDNSDSLAPVLGSSYARGVCASSTQQNAHMM